jgi:hypothetical protein
MPAPDCNGRRLQAISRMICGALFRRSTALPSSFSWTAMWIARRGPVPMRLAQRELHHVTRPDFLD